MRMRQLKSRLVILILTASCLCGCANATAAGQADVIVIGNTGLKPVVEVIAGIESAMKSQVPVYAPAEIKGKLSALVKKRGTRTVIALGREAINESFKLPTSVTVLYSLVILPPVSDRPNTAGLYMGTPVREYLNIVKTYLPCIKHVCVIASSRVLDVLDRVDNKLVSTFTANTPYDLVHIIKGLDKQHCCSVLLLPDTSLLTTTALHEIYLFSFRHKLPILGISKKYVRQGTLFALEFDNESLGRRLGKMAAVSLKQHSFIQLKALPPQHFDLYINRETAKKMEVPIPDQMLKTAKSVYP